MKKALHLFFTTLMVNVMQAQPCPSITSFSVTPPSCFGLSNGCIEINYTTGTAPYTVTWSSGLPQTTSSALSQTVCGVPSGAYSATVTDNNGCIVSSVVNVSQPSLLNLMTTPNTTICYGQSTQIAAIGQGGTPPYTYSWTAPFIGSGPHTVNPTSTTVYYVTASDGNGCVSSPGTITINVTPPLTASGFLITRCEGTSTSLSPIITSPGSGGPYTYNWSNGTVNTSSILVNASLPSPNIYSVSITDGCTVPSATVVFTVNVNPNPTSSFNINPTSGCAPLTVTLTGASNGTNDVMSWSESINGNIGSGNPQVYVFQNSGNYDISLTVTNSITGCLSSTFLTGFPVSICSGINELNMENSLSIFPNPIDKILSITSVDREIQKLDILNITAQVLLSEKINAKSKQLQLLNLESGIYFAKVTFDNGDSIIKKIVKQD